MKSVAPIPILFAFIFPVIDNVDVPELYDKFVCVIIADVPFPINKLPDDNIFVPMPPFDTSNIPLILDVCKLVIWLPIPINCVEEVKIFCLLFIKLIRLFGFQRLLWLLWLFVLLWLLYDSYDYA